MKLIKKHYSRSVLICFHLVLISFSALFSQYQNAIFKLENPDFSLKKRLFIALKQTLRENCRKRIWIGYAIKKKDRLKTSYTKYNRNKLPIILPTLKQLITGSQASVQCNENDKNNVLQKATLLALEKIGNKNAHNKLIETEHNAANKFAILMDYSLESGRPRVYQLFIVPIDQVFNFEGRALYWLGNISQKESVGWLGYLFYHNNYLKLRRQILSAISNHTSIPQIFQLFNHIIFGKFDVRLKEESIFWLGRQANDLSDQILCRIIVKAKNINLKKKAILALSQSKSKRALKVIASIAKKNKNRSLRKEAIFSLSQMDNEKSLSILCKIIDRDRDSDIREFCVFVISQIPNKKVYYILKKISKTHPDVKVRKKALYWADKSRNRTALNYLNDVY